jgi:hypothetical protein
MVRTDVAGHTRINDLGHRAAVKGEHRRAAAVMNRGDEIRFGDRLALGIGDRDQRHVAETDVKRLEVVQVLPAVQGGHGTMGDAPRLAHSFSPCRFVS